MMMRLLARPGVLALLFLLCALPTGLGCALLTPIGMFPDELTHVTRADALRYGEVFGVRSPRPMLDEAGNQGVMVGDGIFIVLIAREFADSQPDRPVPAADRKAVEALPWVQGRVYCATQMVEYFPVLYVPAALGLLLGEHVGLSPLYSFYLGRVAMLLVFLAMGTAAIWLARRGNLLLFAVLSLPSAVNLAGSYNQDGVLLGCFALAAALLSRCRPGLSLGWCAALALLTAGVCAKAPYAALLGFCLLPLLDKGLWLRAGVLLLACVAPGLWLLHLHHAGLLAYHRPPYHPGPLWPGARDILLQQVTPGYNLAVLRAHPPQVVLLPVTSFVHDFSGHWRLMLGMLSQDHILIAAWEYPFLALGLVAALLGTPGPAPQGWRGWDAGVGWLVLFAGFIGMELSLYLSWTLAGLDRIEGVQSRYYLPLLPFLILLLPRVPVPARLPRGVFVLPAVVMAVVNVYALPAFIFHLFRMPGP
jgi:hypothetical protein